MGYINDKVNSTSYRFFRIMAAALQLWSGIEHKITKTVKVGDKIE